MLRLAVLALVLIATPALAAPRLGTAVYGVAPPAAARALAVDPLAAPLAEINRLRGQSGVAGLTLNPRLTAAAQAHATDMFTNNYFSHTSRDGRTPGQRITAAGYSWTTYGENIAWGYATWQAAITGWMNSPGHRANILRASFKEIGLGIQGRVYVQDFGTSRTSPNPPPVPPVCPVP